MAYQIDVAIIKETYAAMSDAEILDFAEKEGLALTSDAIVLLRDELKKRSIGVDIMRSIEREIIFQYGLQARKFEEDINRDLFKRAWELAFKMKTNAASNYEIHNKLQEIGINSEYAFSIVGNLKEKSESIIKDSNTDVQAACAVILVGVILVYVSFKIERFEAGAFLVLLGGIVRVFISISKKDKFRRIIDIIDSELTKDQDL
jgi:hypothetical protein